jgi:WhiB family redox-sensing transcriptional regulator
VTDRSARRRDCDDSRWRLDAACRHVDPDLFFPLGHTGAAVEHASAAKSVCRQCPVRDECLEFALSTNQVDGIWGGATEEERRALRQGRRAGLSTTASR